MRASQMVIYDLDGAINMKSSATTEGLIEFSRCTAVKIFKFLMARKLRIVHFIHKNSCNINVHKPDDIMPFDRLIKSDGSSLNGKKFRKVLH